jgi:hypothetical protein
LALFKKIMRQPQVVKVKLNGNGIAADV